MRVLAALFAFSSLCTQPTDTDDPVGDGVYGDFCSTEELCGPGLVCAGDGVCRFNGEPGTAGTGDGCQSTQFCLDGLACDGAGFCAEPGAPGTVDVGGSCDTVADCQLGLRCDDGTCSGFQLPLWYGATCAQPQEDTGAFRLFFEVPGAAPLSEFYRLPFPNDARVIGGRIDMSGHPTPGVLLDLLGDPAAEIMDALGDLPAWGNNQAVLMRFSDSPDFDSLDLGLPGTGSVGVVDLTAGDTYGRLHPVGFRATTGRGQYICHNSLGIDTVDGQPWKPGHTYAAYVTLDATDTQGIGINADADFTAVMGTSAPADERLTRAWQAYEPLRAWVGTTGAQLAGAAVFTVGDPTGPSRDLYTAVQDADAPVASDLHLCTSAGGPFDTAPDRGCDGVARAPHEVQGTVVLPRFQAGTPPFKEPADGGGIDFSFGPPASVATTDVTFSLVLPDVAMPEAGWPVVIYAHGTGGGYQSAVRSGWSERLSDITLDDGSHQRFAVLSYDAVLHGDRRGEENWDQLWLDQDSSAYEPDVLYFNPLNPRAARDNGLQAAADVFALVRWLEGLDWSASASPTGSAVRIDAGDIHYLGHSQGAVSGMAALSVEPGIRSAVISGGGGLLIESLLNKTNPNDLPAAIRVGLADPNIGRYHPVLNLAQAYAEPSDGVNHGVHMFIDPLGGDRKHIFQVYGVGDTYTPDETQIALARSMRVHQVPGAFSADTQLIETTLPATANRVSGTTTGVVVLYAGAGASDPHFVLFDRADTRRQVSHFFGTALRDGTPTVVAP